MAQQGDACGHRPGTGNPNSTKGVRKDRACGKTPSAPGFNGKAATASLPKQGQRRHRPQPRLHQR
eukprot:12937904-Prorocentrum_lima.AAC.1